VCLLLAVRAGPRPWTAWPWPDLLRLPDFATAPLPAAVSRQIPTPAILSSRIVAVAATCLISLTPSSANHGHLIVHMSLSGGESRPYLVCTSRTYRSNAMRTPRSILFQLGLVGTLLVVDGTSSATGQADGVPLRVLVPRPTAQHGSSQRQAAASWSSDRPISHSLLPAPHGRMMCAVRVVLGRMITGKNDSDRRSEEPLSRPCPRSVATAAGTSRATTTTRALLESWRVAVRQAAARWRV
jgi:hypothetical protein